MACRSVEKAEEAAKEIRDATKDVPGAGTVHVVKLDLGSLASVRQCAKELLHNENRINLLVNNAGRIQSLRLRTVQYSNNTQRNHEKLKTIFAGHQSVFSFLYHVAEINTFDMNEENHVSPPWLKIFLYYEVHVCHLVTWKILKVYSRWHKHFSLY